MITKIGPDPVLWRTFVAAYRDVVEAARVAGARSLGDYAQALQAARVPAPKGGNRWSRPSVARVLRYCIPPAD